LHRLFRCGYLPVTFYRLHILWIVHFVDFTVQLLPIAIAVSPVTTFVATPDTGSPTAELKLQSPLWHPPTEQVPSLHPSCPLHSTAFVDATVNVNTKKIANKILRILFTLSNILFSTYPHSKVLLFDTI
jgi:hypothetical protein